MKQTPFDIFHPSIAALYLCAVLGFSMAAFQPVYLAINLVAAITFNVALRGWRATVRTLMWQIPLLLIVTLFNVVFSQQGGTTPFVIIGQHAFYFENFAYGLSMGVMMVAVLQWFSNFSHILTSDKILQLTGNTMPTLGLMITMIMRLVPQFVRRNTEIHNAQLACTSAQLKHAAVSPQRVAVSPHQAAVSPAVPDQTTVCPAVPDQVPKPSFLTRKAESVRCFLRDLSVLMGWGMEDSLETAEAMRARGWGASQKRSTYQRAQMRRSDWMVLIIMGLFIAANGFLAWVACSQFNYFPEISQLTLWWGYIPYLVFLLLPAAFAIKERIIWKR